MIDTKKKLQPQVSVNEKVEYVRLSIIIYN